MRNRLRMIIRMGIVGLVLLLAGCADFAAALPPRPTPFPTLPRLPSVTPVTPSPLPTATIAFPTPTIMPTPTQTPVLGLVTIASNVRSGPGTTFDVLSVVEAGATVNVLGQNGDWYQIMLPEGGEGWLFGQLLDIPEEAVRSLPFIEP